MRLLVTTALALALAPLAFAHDPAGTIKNYCEPVVEWNTHDYGPPATGVLLLFHEDGNVMGDCSGATILDPGTPCVYEDPNSIVGSGIGLCDSDLDPPLADWDRHNEFALGGAWILSGPEAVECFGADPHHAAFGPVSVVDVVLGAGAAFTVAADTVAVGPDECGDFESDESTDCVGSCTVTFGPGLDGSYQVYVTGTFGHVFW